MMNIMMEQDVSAFIIENLSKHDGDGSENVI